MKDLDEAVQLHELIKIKSIDCDCNNVSGTIQSYDCPIMNGYTAIGIVGYAPIGTFEIGINIANLQIVYATQKINICFYKSFQYSLVVYLLYIKTKILWILIIKNYHLKQADEVTQIDNNTKKLYYIRLYDNTTSSPVELIEKDSNNTKLPISKFLFLETETGTYTYYCFGYKHSTQFQCYFILSYDNLLVFLRKMNNTWIRHNINTTIQN